MNICVVVKLRHEAIHSWPECPIEEVSFLRNPHRHEFHITASKHVSHSDRDIEIIMLKRAIQVYLNEMGKDWGSNSCEDVAIKLMKKFDLESCTVLEDGENGAFVCN